LSHPASTSRSDAWLAHAVGASRAELAALAWSFVYFFCLLCGYYVLRPIRDAMGTEYELRWLFMGTFFGMLLAVPVYGALVSRWPRRRFLPAIYAFFIACVLVFYVLLRADTGGNLRGAAFYVWVAVFNLFAVSVFWSFMSDIFSSDQARRLYGPIAAGGTAGALLGPMLTVGLVSTVGVANMLLISAFFLGVCLLAISRLVPWARAQEQRLGWKAGEDAIGGSIIGGATLIARSPFLQAACLLMFFGVAVGTLLYNLQQAYAASEFPDRATRAAFFGRIDLTVNLVVLVVQLTVTRIVLRRYGPAPLVLIPSIAIAIGFALLTMNPAPLLVIAVQVMTRAGEFALAKPARESYYTRIERELRYKSKNFIDTVVYRGGDLTFAWVYDGLVLLGYAKAGIAAFGAAMAALMAASAAWMVWVARGLPADAHQRDGDGPR
jgi:AAA family ATP:ADP antiporter